jgi:hypothetical protein
MNRKERMAKEKRKGRKGRKGQASKDNDSQPISRRERALMRDAARRLLDLAFEAGIMSQSDYQRELRDFDLNFEVAIRDMLDNTQFSPEIEEAALQGANQLIRHVRLKEQGIY